MNAKALKIIDGLAHCLPETEADGMMDCITCPYYKDCHYYNQLVSLPIEMVEDIRSYIRESVGKCITQ